MLNISIGSTKLNIAGDPNNGLPIDSVTVRWGRERVRDRYRPATADFTLAIPERRLRYWERQASRESIFTKTVTIEALLDVIPYVIFEGYVKDIEFSFYKETDDVRYFKMHVSCVCITHSLSQFELGWDGTVGSSPALMWQQLARLMAQLQYKVEAVIPDELISTTQRNSHRVLKNNIDLSGLFTRDKMRAMNILNFFYSHWGQWAWTFNPDRGAILPCQRASYRNGNQIRKPQDALKGPLTQIQWHSPLSLDLDERKIRIENEFAMRYSLREKPTAWEVSRPQLHPNDAKIDSMHIPAVWWKEETPYQVTAADLRDWLAAERQDSDIAVAPIRIGNVPTRRFDSYDEFYFWTRPFQDGRYVETNTELHYALQQRVRFSPIGGQIRYTAKTGWECWQTVVQGSIA